MTETFFDEAFNVPLMAILRGYDPEVTVQLCRRAWQCGIGLVEVPIQDARARRSFQAAVSAGTQAGQPVGAGTVITTEQVEFAARAGAHFTVAPGLSEAVIHACHSAGIPHLPGVATATEVARASQLGVIWMKVFPASDLGAKWITSMHGPFPQARFVATGGIDLGNAQDYFEHGAAAVSLGSALGDEDQFARMPRFIASLHNGGLA